MVSGGQAAIKAHLASIAKLRADPPTRTASAPRTGDPRPRATIGVVGSTPSRGHHRPGPIGVLRRRATGARQVAVAPPQYDKYGVRTNTRELRIKAKLEDERSS